MPEMPPHYLLPLEPFEQSFSDRHDRGRELLASSRVAFVGLARNCGPQLAVNLERLLTLADGVGEWRLHVESNDCTDNTVPILADFRKQHPEASYQYLELGRGNYSGEFAGRRTIALAQYRTACQTWVRENAAEFDYVAVIDLDMWGGWSHPGVLNAIGWLADMPEAYGMASVSLFQHDFGGGPMWCHYDLWALRGVGQPQCYWDTYRNAYFGWGYTWFPPVGSPPVLVASAFGGMGIYRTAAYLAGTYNGEEDCEHVPFHRSIAKRTGQKFYVCPSMRTVMSWMEPTDAGDGINSVPSVSNDAP